MPYVPRQEYFDNLRKARIAQIERNFPDEIKEQDRWAVYKTFKKEDEKTGDTKITKKILDCHYDTDVWAKANDSSTCSSFADAKDAMFRLNARGLSFNLMESPYTVVDLDGVFVDGQYSQLAQEIMNLTDGTLMERSVSGTGVHIFLKGKKDFLMPGYKTKSDGGLEVFDNKFISVTGDTFPTSTKEIKEPSYELVELLKERLGKTVETGTQQQTSQRSFRTTDDKVLERAKRGKVAQEFEGLYYRGDTSRYGCDHSRADFRLCGLLAYYTGGDEEQTRRLFESSALYRSAKGDDYVTRTVRKACRGYDSGSGK